MLAMASAAQAQNWSFDARKIAMGSAGDGNLAITIVDESDGYRALVVPLGLLQVLRDLRVFQPGSDRYDFIRTIEYAASPLHYVFGRDATSRSGRQLLVDVRNATVSRDLNSYRGLVPANQPVAEGLSAPQFGGTITLRRGNGAAFDGIYVGAGPYLALRTALDVDPRLVNLLASATDVYIPNARLQLANATRGELALAFTGGYRGRYNLPLGSTAEALDGIYLAVDYNYLRGVHLEQVDASLALDTDAAGLLAVNLSAPPPVVLQRQHASSGHGLAVDVAAAVVVGGWQFGMSARGVGNRIDWSSSERLTYTLGNVFIGDSRFGESATTTAGDVRVELPVDYRAIVAYRTGPRSAALEYAHGFQRTSLRLGAEERWGPLYVRAGAIYGRDRWAPTGGVGMTIGPRVALDLALFGTSANVERRRKAALATSLRFLF
jgi:hypothetical protein